MSKSSLFVTFSLAVICVNLTVYLMFTSQMVLTFLKENRTLFSCDTISSIAIVSLYYLSFAKQVICVKVYL